MASPRPLSEECEYICSHLFTVAEVPLSKRPHVRKAAVDYLENEIERLIEERLTKTLYEWSQLN